MNTRFLFAHSMRKIGWIILIPASICGVLIVFFDIQVPLFDGYVFSLIGNSFGEKGFQFFTISKGNYFNTVVGIVFLIGALLVGFSKEKTEDEFIAKIRLESLVWAMFLNTAILIFCFAFIFDFLFLTVMILNMFTTLILFIIRFKWLLFRSRKLYSE